MKLDTVVGSVDAKLLSARSILDSDTIAFKLRYHGNAKLKVSPFAVDFVSPQSGVRYGLYPSTSELLVLAVSFLPALINTILEGAPTWYYVS